MKDFRILVEYIYKEIYGSLFLFCFSDYMYEDFFWILWFHNFYFFFVDDHGTNFWLAFFIFRDWLRS